MPRTVCRALLGRDVAPLRRTKSGLLNLPHLEYLTDWYEKGKASSKNRLEPKCLLPSQFAFLHRLGLKDPVGGPKLEADWIECFYPEGYRLGAVGQQLFEHGSKALRFFTKEFVGAKWPLVPLATKERVMESYAGANGISALARLHGMDECLVNVVGLREPLCTDLGALNDRIRSLVFPQISRNAKKHANSDEMLLRRALDLKPARSRQEEQAEMSERQAWSMASVFGVIRRHFGPKTLKAFLDARLFSADVGIHDLYQCEYPLVELTEYLRGAGNKSVHPEFRLLKESGRLSTSPTYLIGVYLPGTNVPGEKLGEGYGPSVLLAQQRACIDALRKIHLQVNDPVSPRPSDTSSDADLNRSIDQKY